MKTKRTKRIALVLATIGLGLVAVAVTANRLLASSAGRTAPTVTPAKTAAASPPIEPSSSSPPPRPSHAPVTPAPRPTTRSLFSLTDPASAWLIVNKWHGIPTSYVPDGLVLPQVRLQYASSLDQMKLRPDAAVALERLLTAADRDGRPMMLMSGYRSAAYQAMLYNRAAEQSGAAAAALSTALPGRSEHQTGLAADLNRTDRHCELMACFGQTPEGQWLAAHAAEYGFIVRYPLGKEAVTGYQYEPWHIRYVGVELAKHLQATGQILDEFDGRL